MKRKSYILGKINYIIEVIQNYPNWYSIFINRILGININKIKLRNGIKISGGKNSLILDLIKEIFIDKVYNPEFLKIHKGDTVVDIGANIGVFSLYAAKEGASKIYSIEPLHENTIFIKRNFSINKLITPIIFEVAVSDHEGLEKLYLGDLDSHGVLQDRNSMQAKSDFVKVKTTTLKLIIESNRIQKIDFLKIDCEGSEGEILKSTPEKVWKKIKKVVIEYHDSLSILSHQEIINKMIKNGYKERLKTTGNSIGYIYAWKS